jgi:hypothetical protein
MDAFTRAYIEAALWSSNDESDESGGEPLDKNYSIQDIAPATLRAMERDCADFQEKYVNLVEDDDSSAIDKWGRWDLAGHDFWLTRNGHGAGFGDGNFPKHDDKLYEAAKSYGEFELYVGDDGLIYAPGHETDERVNERRQRVRTPNRVADFSTLPELIEHARDVDGATHVHIAGRQVTLFYPRTDGRFAQGVAWQARGYWHAPGPSDRAIINRLPPGAEPIGSHTRRAGRQVSGRGSRARKKSAVDVASELAKKLGGYEVEPIPGGFRWSQQNESAQFTTYSPERQQKVVVVVGIFADGSTAIEIFSDEGLSGIEQYENISSFTYPTADVRSMAADVEWVWKTVDEYAASWDEGEMDEKARRAPTSRTHNNRMRTARRSRR